MNLARLLTDAEKADLAALTAAIDAALAARTAWLDAKMVDCATLKVGEEIYDLEQCCCVGKVTELYRYWQHQNPIFDTELSVDYKFQLAPGECIENTSSQPGRAFGTKEQAYRRASFMAGSLAP